MRNKILKYTVSLLFGSFFLSSCNDMEQIPSDKFIEDNYWTTETKALRVVNMAYSQMYSAGNMWTDESLSDNLVESRGNSSEKSIRNGIADPSTETFAETWKKCYEGIKTCHVYLEKVHFVPNLSEESEKSMSAQIRFIRASLFFRMTNFYGDIPFFTKDISLEESRTISRTPRAKVLEFVHQQLDSIIVDLPSKTKLADADRGRITKGAAIALQARAYLYESDWKNVQKYCEMLINEQAENGVYGLYDSYTGLFLAENEYNKEVVLDYAYAPIQMTWSEIYDMAPLSIGGRLSGRAPTQELVDSYTDMDGKKIGNDPASRDDSYTNRDPRLTATVAYHGYEWSKNVTNNNENKVIYIKPGSTPKGGDNRDEYINSTSNSTATGYYVRKYFDPKHENDLKHSSNIIMIRYADVLLMYAEAMIEQNLMTSKIWDTTIGAIRERAGLNTVAIAYPTGSTQASLRDIVRNERRVELALEGLRWYDIKRWQIGEEVLNNFVYGAKFDSNRIRLDKRRFSNSKDYLWSVPRSQMDLNANLKPNNPGYSN